MAGRENPGIAVLLSVLPSNLTPTPSESEVLTEWAGRRFTFRPVWVGEGFPLDIRRALAAVDLASDSVTTVFTARNMSPGARQMLANEGLAWADAAGFAEIEVPSTLYIKRARPAPLNRSATTSLKWSASTEAVAEYVLARRAQLPRMADGVWNGVDRLAHISEATEISSGQVARVLVNFDDEGYTAKFGPERGPTSTRELRDATRLLSDWAGHYSRSAHKERRAELHVPWRETAESTELARRTLHDLPWAISGWAAADLIAPFVTNVPDLTIYVAETHFDTAVKRLTQDPDITQVERGGRIRLRSAARYLFEFARTSDAAPVVSSIRVYGDLLRVGGRGAEAAEHLREVSIGF